MSTKRLKVKEYEFRPGYAGSEKPMEGESMATSEKNGGALPKRQAGCPGTEGLNNYRRFPHGFPQEAWIGEEVFLSRRDTQNFVT